MSNNKILHLASAAAVLWAIATHAQGNDPRRIAFYTALTNAFIVSTNGAVEATDLIQMVDGKWIDSAAGNQATQPYKRLEVPMYPWGPADNPVDHALDMFRLRPDEAVVYLGPTPPPCDYFSFTVFLFLRNTNSVVPKGDWLFASVRDPLNNARIQTEAGPGRPFGVNTMVIFTADQTTYQAVTNAAQQAGYPASMLNLYTLPANELYLGVEPGTRPDTLVAVLRTANFTDSTAGQQYLANTNYAAVYRVTPRTARDLNPLEPPAWRNRESTNEWELIAQRAPGWVVTNALDRLQQAIVSTTPHVDVKSFNSTRWFVDSRDVLADDPASPAYRQFAAGESSDTTYLRTATDVGAATNFTLGTDDALVVYGVNHAAAGLVTYANFTIYGDWKLSSCTAKPLDPDFYDMGCGDPIWNGVAGLNNRSYAGSAAQYLPDDSPATNLLYAVMVVRGSLVAQRSGAGLMLRRSYGTLEAADSVSGPWLAVPGAAAPSYTVSLEAARAFYRVKLPNFCLLLSNPPDPLPSPYQLADWIPFDYPAFVGYRAYLNPATRSGPSYNNIIPDRVLWFKLR
jgi:hypothetical protein